MDEIFDLFGNPVRERAGQRGRPPYEASEKDRNKVKLLLAMGWAVARIANGIGVSPATLKRYFRAELKVRDAMRDRLEARRLEIAMEQANDGSIAALKHLGALIERNDRMEVEREMSSDPKKPASAQERVGKKSEDRQRAMDADADLMAELESEAASNARH